MNQAKNLAIPGSTRNPVATSAQRVLIDTGYRCDDRVNAAAHINRNFLL
jgi:hypothetical protein